MARKPAPAARAPRPVDPTQEALARIAELIGRGSDRGRVVRDADAIIASWQGVLPSQEMQERLDALSEQLAEGVEAAQEQAGDVERDDKVGSLVAGRAVASLVAARDTFGKAASAFQ